MNILQSIFRKKLNEKRPVIFVMDEVSQLIGETDILLQSRFTGIRKTQGPFVICMDASSRMIGDVEKGILASRLFDAFSHIVYREGDQILDLAFDHDVRVVARRIADRVEPWLIDDIGQVELDLQEALHEGGRKMTHEDRMRLSKLPNLAKHHPFVKTSTLGVTS